MVNPFQRFVPTSHYILLAVFFWVSLELILAFHQWFILVTAVLLAIVVYGIFLVRFEEADRFNSAQIILPTLAVVGLTGLAIFLPRMELLHGYILIASILFYGLLRHGARLAYPTWNWLISLLVLFVNVAVILGIRFYLYVPLTVTLVALFGVIVLISYQALHRVAESARYAVMLSLGLSLAMTEIAWTLQFLPLVYLIQAGMLVSIYYVFFFSLTLSMEKRLTRQKLWEYGLLGLSGGLILLFSARWL